MRRFMLALLITLLPSFAYSQTTVLSVDLRFALAPLGIEHVFGLLPVELDGRHGAEYLVKVNPFAQTWAVIYPQAPGGPCNAGTITFFLNWDLLFDTNGDGKMEIIRFDSASQTATWSVFPIYP